MSFSNVLNYLKSFVISPVDSEQPNDFSERFYAGDNDIKKDIKRSNVPGIVTFMDCAGNGRIDGYINFDKSSSLIFKCDSKRVVIGSEVLMDVTRNSKTSPWYVTSMEVLSCPNVDLNDDWDEMLESKSSKIMSNSEKLPKKQVGMITYAYNDDLCLNNEINFRQRDCGPNSFRPVRGDWVVVEFDHSIDPFRVVGLIPLRYIDFEGCVSNISGEYGYVDREIQFHKRISKQPLRIGTAVFGTALESVQNKRCNFRALTIFPKKGNRINRGLQMRLKRMEKTDARIQNPHSLGLHLTEMVLDFGEQNMDEIVMKELVLKNENGFPVMIASVKLSSETNNQFIVEGKFDNFELGSRAFVNLLVKCKPQFPGLDTQQLFISGSDENRAFWMIAVNLSVYASDPTMREVDTKTNCEFKKDGGHSLPSDNITGVHLSAAAPVKLRSMQTKVYPHKLKMYPVPAELEAHVESRADINSLYPVLKQSLSQANYVAKMNLLIHLEEINTKIEMRQFVLENVRLISRRDTFGIEVPGLSEGRPSLMVGDKVELKINGGLQWATSYSGSIEDIMHDCIFARFHTSLHANYSNEECTVTFTHSRLPFRRMHLGIELASGTLGDSIVFPKRVIRKSSQCLRLSRTGQAELSSINFKRDSASVELQFYNQSLNELQRVAVVRIVHGYSRPLPYVLFGPPGTGKTVTLVEAVLQVYKNVPTSRILLCAPSNSAADLLCLRLDESGVIDTGEMVRMNAYRRSIMSEMSDKEPIPPRVLPYCKSVEDLAEVAMHRIIICTCISSGSIYRLGLKPGHITHVFVDEAGQASEPEIMVPLGLVSLENGQIILAGDPMQLGPVIRSPHAQQLQESYLHRMLLSCDLYQKQKDICAGSSTHYDPLLVTQLLHNYRAHPMLLKLPSEMFYDGSLIACTNKLRFINWKWLPNPQVPLIFHGVRGKEMRNQRNPSTYNPSEAVMVVRWIGRLLQEESDGTVGKLEDRNISVITPYRAQVDCIRKMIKNCLEDVNLAKLKIASVEEFQGQENEIVIISTVRSSLEDNSVSGAQESMAIINTVGKRLAFLSNKRRFNVSITRACSLLIVIGDPALLQYDECWNRLIKYSKANRAYTGVDC